MSEHEPLPLIASLLSALRPLKPNDSASSLADWLTPDIRNQAIGLAQELLIALQGPENTIMSLAYCTSSQTMCLRLFIDLKLPELLASSAPQPLSISTISQKTAADTLLLSRVLRVLASIGFVKEEGEGFYAANDIVHALTKPDIVAAVRSASDDSVQIQARLPGYYREKAVAAAADSGVNGVNVESKDFSVPGGNAYVCPEDSRDCPLQWTMNTDLHYFEWVAANPAQLDDLQTSMAAMQGDATQWFDFYPVKEKLLQGWLEGDTLLVDVGGGEGHELRLFKKRFDVEGSRLMLQDLESVVGNGSENPGDIKVMPHDFFDEQPVKGARAYYTHRVFHNWSDKNAKMILQQLKDAMRPGYSKLLINEAMLPGIKCSAFAASGDLNMMCILGGIKRTQSQWVNLIESTGLQIEKIWQGVSDGNTECLIEVMQPA